MFHGRRFTWNFLLAAVSFPIVGVDFLRHFQLMVDPAANMLVDKASLQSFVTVLSLTAASSPAPAVVEDPAALPTVTGLQSPVNSHRSSVTGQRETAALSSPPPGRWSGLLFPLSPVHSHRSTATGPQLPVSGPAALPAALSVDSVERLLANLLKILLPAILSKKSSIFGRG
jgi:hypothetical protein